MITVFGALTMDIAMPCGHHPRAGETVVTDAYLLSPGGKGANQAVAARRAGADAAMYGAVGADMFAQAVLDNMEAEGFDTATLKPVDGPNGCAAIFVEAGGENCIVIARGANAHARAGDVPDSAMTPDHILVLQAELDLAESWHLARRARDRGCRVLLNVAPATAVPADVLAALDWLVCNEIEIAMVADALHLPAEPPEATARRLARDHDLVAVVTLGEKGALAATPDGHLLTAPALAVDVVDTTGAGDAFCGAFAAALDAGLDLQTALRRGAAGGSLACTRLGAQAALPIAAAITDALKS